MAIYMWREPNYIVEDGSYQVTISTTATVCNINSPIAWSYKLTWNWSNTNTNIRVKIKVSGTTIIEDFLPQQFDIDFAVPSWATNLQVLFQLASGSTTNITNVYLSYN